MKIKLLLWILVSILLVFNINAQYTDASGYFTMDNVDISDTSFLDKALNKDADIKNGVITGLSGVLNEEIFLDGVNDHLLVNHTTDYNFGTSPFTINFWLNFTSTTAGLRVISQHGNTPYFDIYTFDSGKLYALSADGSLECKIGTIDALNDNVKHFVTFTKNGTDCTTDYNFMVDGVKNSQVIGDQNAGNLNGTDNFFIGCNGGAVCGGSYFVGNIDEVSIYKYEFELSDHQTFYNSGNGYNPYASSPATPTLTLNSNLVSQSNYSLSYLNYTFNGTLNNNTIDIANCSIYYNQALNQTIELNLSINNNFQYDLYNYENTFNVSINCSNFEVSDDIGPFVYNIDNVFPRITVTGLLNNSNHVQYSNIVVTSSFFDPNLFAYNITYFNPVGTELQNYFAQNLNVNETINVSSYTLDTLGSNFSYRVEAWDSHTNNKIKDFNIIKGTDFIQFDNIKIYNSDGELKKIDYYKKSDRYTFLMEFDKKDQWQTLYIESTNLLYYLPNSEYNAHFVDFESRKWVDFNSPDITNYIITKQSDFLYQIDFYNLDKYVYFESIGALNYNSQVYNFNVMSQDTQYLISIDSTIKNIDTTTDDIYEVLKMIPIVTLYVSLLAIAYWMFRTKNVFSAYILFILTFFLDLLLVGLFYDLYFTSLQNIYFMDIFLTFGLVSWILFKLIFIVTIKSSYKIIY